MNDYNNKFQIKVMKVLSFRNSSNSIQNILKDNNKALSTNSGQQDDWDLQFSTFRSEDYIFSDSLPRFYQKNNGQD